MIRALVVDDEKLARERLLSFLRKFDDVEVVGEAANGVEAVERIGAAQPDVVFLDVQMPGMDGFAVLKALKHAPHVVFATAYDEYAIKAFEVHAADYLLKPISRARLEEALRRLRLRLHGNAPALEIDQLVKRLEARERRYLSHVPVHRGRNILVVPAQQILWFEVEYRLVYAHVDGDRYMTNFTLKELEDRLDPKMFFRAHKSRLVNLEHVRAIVPWFAGRFKLMMRDKTGSEVELSRSQARELRERMHW
ncbi:MAG TPA: LytTR family DNA-binding domain-containing protein [Terriglobales bacterium]|nr:LytTR family DNA-binding domain-containing protein [Terriglobales bacterium]